MEPTHSLHAHLACSSDKDYKFFAPNPFHRFLGQMSPLIFVLLLEGKANLQGCGSLELPSSDAMKQASPKVIDRLHELETRSGVICMTVATGFPWADVPEVG